MVTIPTFTYEHPSDLSPEALDTLETIQKRVLWLATYMIHYANAVSPNQDGTKVGGHQASSASVVTILTALYFHMLKTGDRIAIKPHASPVFHAIQYLLGQLPRGYLTTLRAYQGLQSYPSRTKDPDQVDFSTGSVGLGAVAPAFAALAHKYTQAHFGSGPARRFIALVGDAELDEGNVWEAILDESLEGLDNLLWVVDLNRQSLDRVVPGIRAARLKGLFAKSGWRVLEAKFGRRLQAVFAQPGGEAFRERIDEMSNQEYQALICLPGVELRPRLVEGRPGLASLLAPVSDEELPSLLSNLGGHDLAELISVLDEAMANPSQPTIVFAYTIKGWGLPIAGLPLNHSMLLNDAQIEALRDSLGIPAGEELEPFESGSLAGQLCQQVAERLYLTREEPILPPSPEIIPEKLSTFAPGVTTSSQDTFGRLLVRIADIPALRARIVTSSPDVSVSTNLAGWINKCGAFKLNEEQDFETDTMRLLNWKRGPHGQHIELGISEMNLFLLLAMFGLSEELTGQLTLPIGTLYDPFICRGLDSLIYALYCGSKFIFAGTPSGITLSREGGAHQSLITPAIGAELPNLRAYELCFTPEVEWALLDGLRECFDRKHGRAMYLRLSTRPIDQSLLQPAWEQIGEEHLRQQVLAGGYRLRDWRYAGPDVDPRAIVTIAASGALIPEACAAADYLWQEGVATNVLNITSSRQLFEAWRAKPSSPGQQPLLDWLFLPQERRAPIVTVQDSAPHSLAWLGSVFGAPVHTLGVDEFGQSGARSDLYEHFGLDTESIVKTAFNALEEAGS